MRFQQRVMLRAKLLVRLLQGGLFALPCCDLLLECRVAGLEDCVAFLKGFMLGSEHLSIYP